MPGPALTPQAPLSVAEVATLFADITSPWWIAGGWAIDLFIGHQTREHEDIDVSILRRDQSAVHDALAGWDVYVADPPGALRPWPTGEYLPVGKHDVWCRRTPEDPWSVWVMLNESEDDFWVFRREPSIRLPVATVVRHTADGVPYFAPHVQLLYKAKHLRQKDLADFEAAASLLADEERTWLRDRLIALYGDHVWVAALE